MSNPRSPAPLRRSAALAATALALFASGCQKGPPPQPDARLSIAASTLSGPVQPGDKVSFRVTVSNVGNSDVALVDITSTLDPHLAVRSVACSPLGKAAYNNGDEPCHDFVSLAKIAKGATVTLDIVASLDAHAQGTLTNTFSAAAFSGPPPVTASNQAAIVDGRGGAYTAFTSDGRALALAADFAGSTLTFSGNGADVAVPFTLPNGPAYRAASNTGFLAHRDLLAGTAPLDGGTPAFIAARNFVTSVAALDGHAFDVFEIDTPAAGPPVSRFRTALVSGSTMQLCADLAPYTLAACPAASLRHYDLALSGSVFTAVDAADADTMTFQVAQSSGTDVLLRAESTPAGRVFQVGLSANAVVATDVFQGGDTVGHWGNISVNPDTLQQVWTLQDGNALSQNNAQIAAIANAPASLLASTIAGGSRVWLAEDGDLAILLGHPGDADDGLLQLFAY